jgi:hypothetical protein
MNPTHKLINKELVEIQTEFYKDPWKMKREGIELAIQNVKKNREQYKTEEAYQKHLDLFEEALRILDSAQNT